MSNIVQVLIVEPDTVTGMILEKFLHSLYPGIELMHTGTGKDTIRLLKTGQLPALVVAEPVLPDMSPKEFLKALKADELFTKTRICLLSVLYMHELDELCAALPVTRYFSKPLSAAAIGQICHLLDAVRNRS